MTHLDILKNLCNLDKKLEKYFDENLHINQDSVTALLFRVMYGIWGEINAQKEILQDDVTFCGCCFHAHLKNASKVIHRYSIVEKEKYKQEPLLFHVMEELNKICIELKKTAVTECGDIPNTAFGKTN